MQKEDGNNFHTFPKSITILIHVSVYVTKFIGHWFELISN